MIHHVDSIGSYIVMVAANCRTVSMAFLIVAPLEQSKRNCHGRNWKDCSNGLMSSLQPNLATNNRKVPSRLFFFSDTTSNVLFCDLWPEVEQI